MFTFRWGPKQRTRRSPVLFIIWYGHYEDWLVILPYLYSWISDVCQSQTWTSLHFTVHSPSDDGMFCLIDLKARVTPKCFRLFVRFHCYNCGIGQSGWFTVLRGWAPPVTKRCSTVTSVEAARWAFTEQRRGWSWWSDHGLHFFPIL